MCRLTGHFAVHSSHLLSDHPAVRFMKSQHFPEKTWQRRRETFNLLFFFFFPAFFIYYFELSSNLFPSLFLLSLTPIKHANPRWLTWQGVNTGGKSWSLGGRAETLRQGIGTTSNTFPEHRHARCLCHPPARLGWPASSRLHTPTCKREPAQGKVHLEGKASSPQRRWEEDRGSCEIPWLCFKKEVF